ncbi:uncharacterized protein [Montipora foliosa]|uniref:uncharacterized protein isoform X1 n=1 Tax=Montipora foliosa TaxID=591990 RepID=UPI0035F1F4FA
MKKMTKQALAFCILGLLAVSFVLADDDDDDNPEIEADEAAGEVRSRPTVHTPGPWFDRILGLIHSGNFRGVYKKYLDNLKQRESADTTTEELSRRNSLQGPVRQVYVKEERSRKGHHNYHHHHHRHNQHSRRSKVKKWVNVKIVNQVGSRVKIKANKILPSAVLSSGEIFVYHRLLNGTDRKATITIKAIDEYTDKPLIINGEKTFFVRPTTYGETQEAYIAREDTRSGILHARHGHIVKSLGSGNRWFYVKLINHAGGRARIVSDQILPATTLDVDESQVEYARLEPGDEYKRIVLRAVDVKNKEPLQLNGEYTLGLRPDDSGDVARVKITRGDTIYAKCDNFEPMQESAFEYQVSTDEMKSWFDAVRACKLCNAELLSVHTREENEFITDQLRRSTEVNKLWIGMSYKEEKRMWSWIDGSRYRYQNWKEGQHYDGKDEQCGIVYQRYDWGRWDDDNCYKPFGFICKRHRRRNAEKTGNYTDSSIEKRGCPNILSECPSLCRIVRSLGSCPRCDCGQLVKGFDTMTPEEQAKVRNLFSEANHQTHQAGLHKRAMRRFTIMREASRLMAESRNLQLAADQEGIPLNVPFFQGAWQRHQISRPDKNTNEIANAIVGLISDIAKSEDGRKRGGKKRLTKPLKE